MTHPISITNARLLPITKGDLPRRGETMRDLAPITRGTIVLRDGRIEALGESVETHDDTQIIDAKGRVVMPAFVDCHTHACWAGDRLDEWDRKRSGMSYLEILESGGGIMSTVRAVREASVSQLTESLLERLNWMLSEGTTACEVKSGYGLSTKDELKMLDAIVLADQNWPGRVSITACIGHAKDADIPDFVEQTIRETLPAVNERYPGIAIDAYCEQGAWSVHETVRLFEAAHGLGHPVRVHADQFNALGMLEAAIELGALSVDHLEATGPDSLEALARSGTMGVMLPCSGFQVDDRYGDGRAFIDNNGALAIATNMNPGSAPCFSMPMAIALATRKLGITTAEAITASTVNAAHLLGFTDQGTLEAGKRADIIMLRHRDERQLGYTFGGSHTELVICEGSVVA